MVWRGGYYNCQRVQVVVVDKYYIILHKQSFFLPIASIQMLSPAAVPVSIKKNATANGLTATGGGT